MKKSIIGLMAVAFMYCTATMANTFHRPDKKQVITELTAKYDVVVVDTATSFIEPVNIVCEYSHMIVEASTIAKPVFTYYAALWPPGNSGISIYKSENDAKVYQLLLTKRQIST